MIKNQKSPSDKNEWAKKFYLLLEIFCHLKQIFPYEWKKSPLPVGSNPNTIIIDIEGYSSK